MLNRDTQGYRRDDREDDERKPASGHSLVGAAVCLGAGALIALVAILGQFG